MQVIEEEDDEPAKIQAIEEALSGPTSADIDAYLANTNREGLKRGILVYNKEARFGKSQSDEALREILKNYMLDDEMLDLTIPF